MLVLPTDLPAREPGAQLCGSRSVKKASTASTACCCRWAVSVEWPFPSSSTLMNRSPIWLVSVSNLVPVAGSLR